MKSHLPSHIHHHQRRPCPFLQKHKLLKLLFYPFLLILCSHSRMPTFPCYPGTGFLITMHQASSGGRGASTILLRMLRQSADGGPAHVGYDQLDWHYLNLVLCRDNIHLLYSSSYLILYIIAEHELYYKSMSNDYFFLGVLLSNNQCSSYLSIGYQGCH